MEQLGGGHRVVEGPVRRPVGEPEAVGERAEPAVRHLVAHQPAGDGQRVDDDVRQARVPVTLQGAVDEREVEADVVPDDHGVAEELQERGQHRLDAWCGDDHRIGDPGEHGDGGSDRPPGVDERRERAEALAAAHLRRADLGDHVLDAIAARGLDVEHAERDLGQGRAEVVEAALAADRRTDRSHGRTSQHERPFVSRTSVRSRAVGPTSS
ncbi:MAG: hypothetical protein QM733_19605 [Ilumatobacteraceae bacterium]